MRDKTIMIVAIDSTKEDGMSLINALEDYPDGWLRAEWVAREDYAPTVALEKAEYRIKKLEDHLAMIGQIESHKRVPEYLGALEIYHKYRNPSASTQSALDDDLKRD